MPATPSASYSLTLRVRLEHKPGMLGEVLTAIGNAGALIGAIDIVEVSQGHFVRDISVDARDQAHWELIIDAVKGVEGAELMDFTDRTLTIHIGGKIAQANKYPLKTRDDLAMAYTPGVARVCSAIKED